MIEIKLDEGLYKRAEKILQVQGLTVEAAITDFMKKIVMFGNYEDADEMITMFMEIISPVQSKN